MGADFAGLNIALSSLYAQRRGLDVTGQNIANVNTAGYTRQRVVLAPAGGSTVPSVFSTPNGIGEGVQYSATDRLRDAFLEVRSITEHGTLAQALTTQQVFARVEQAFGEPSDTGLQAQLGAYWNAWDDVANHPEDPGARAQLIQRAQGLVTGLTQANTALASQWSSTREQLSAVVDDVNSTAASVASLNQQILSATKAGLSPNDLMDQRDLLVQRLADLAGVTARPGDGGVVNVFLGGTALVNGNRAEKLQVSGATTFQAVPDPATNPTSPAVYLSWAKDGYPAAISSGQTGGMLTALNGTLPSYRYALDKVVTKLVTDVNAVHAGGTDSNGVVHAGGFDMSGTAGTSFFTIGDPANPTASLRLTFTDPALVAASGKAGGPNHDGSNAVTLANFAGQGADRDYRKLIVALGVESQTAGRRAEIQAAITTSVDAAREANSAVNIDEEMTNMVAYQQAYNAAARYLTSVDQMLDTLIKSTGLVGR